MLKVLPPEERDKFEKLSIEKLIDLFLKSFYDSKKTDFKTAEILQQKHSKYIRKHSNN